MSPRPGIRGKAGDWLVRTVRWCNKRNIPGYHQVWAIGIYGGDAPFELLPLAGIQNPVLTRAHVSDSDARFVADPFALRVADEWFLFFEIFDRPSGLGRIGMATSRDGLEWCYQGVVLVEPFHLSYPCVFSWHGRYFMIPESGMAKAVRLYEAEAFPVGWRYVGSLLAGQSYLDASIFQWTDRWWLFTAEEHGGAYDTLRLFTSPDLFGPWKEHPGSPVISGDSRAARPAGKPVLWEGKLYRFAQDCIPHYGAAVRAFEIRRLTSDEYDEVEAWPQPVLAASGQGWNALGMHHLDLHLRDGRWLAFVDGHVNLLE